MAAHAHYLHLVHINSTEIVQVSMCADVVCGWHMQLCVYFLCIFTVKKLT